MLIFLRAVAAIAVMLLPFWLLLGGLGLAFGLPLIALALILASPGLAWLHMLNRKGLGGHLLLGAAVGSVIAFYFVATIPNSDLPPNAENQLNWLGGLVGAFIAAPFGAWNGFVWWAFFDGRASIRRIFSHDALTKPHPNDW